MCIIIRILCWFHVPFCVVNSHTYTRTRCATEITTTWHLYLEYSARNENVGQIDLGFWERMCEPHGRMVEWMARVWAEKQTFCVRMQWHYPADGSYGSSMLWSFTRPPGIHLDSAQIPSIDWSNISLAWHNNQYLVYIHINRLPSSI